MVAGLDADAHLLEGEDGLAAEVAGAVEGGQVEVAALVEGVGCVGAIEVEVFDLRANVEGEAEGGGTLQVALEHVAGVALEGGAVREVDVAEHAGHAALAGAPGKDLEGSGVRDGGHVGLAGAGEAGDGPAVEADALFERLFQLFESDRKALEGAENIGEPEADELHILLATLL